jgi:hypothetical protein
MMRIRSTARGLGEARLGESLAVLLIALPWTVVGGPACSEVQCEEGFVESDGACVPASSDSGSVDGGVIGDAGSDGALADAAPPECTTDGDCSELTPSCAGGRCLSCTATACTETQKLRELIAILCAGSTLREGDDALAETFETLYCSARPELFSVLAQLESAIEAGRLTIDETFFDECRSAFGLDDGACAGVLRGEVESDGACQLEFECDGGFCDVMDDACSGTCLPRRGASGACEESFECDDGLLCIEARCQIPPGDGDACTTRCADGLFCNASMTCEPLRAVDGACRGVGTGGDCADGLACIDRVCTAGPAAGDPCWPAHYSLRCAAGLRCDGTTCRAPRPAGENCTSTAQCERGLRCEAASCAPILPLGASCLATDACAFGTGCIDGRCRALPDVGDACDETLEVPCIRGVCTAGTCTDQLAGAPCDRVTVGFDALDACGTTTSCDGTMCAAEGDVDDSCTDDRECRSPDLECNDDSRCAARCAPL